MHELRRLARFVWPYRWRYLIGLLCLLCCDGLQLLIPRVCKTIIELLETGQLTAALLWRHSLSIVVIAAVIVVFRWFWRQNILVTSRRVERDVRRAYFSRLLELSNSYFDKAKIGDLMARATNDVTAVQRLCGPGVFASFDGIVLCVFALAFMIHLEPSLTLIAIAPLPFVTIKVLVLGRRIHQRAEAAQKSFANLSQTVQESIAGIRVLKDFGQERAQEEHFRTVSREYLDKNLRLVAYTCLTHPLLVFVIEISFALALLYGGWQVMTSGMTLGALVAFLAYLEILIWPAIAIGWVVNLIQRGLASLGRIGTILDSVPDIRDGDGVSVSTAELLQSKAAIELRHLSFSYGDDVQSAMRDLSLSLPWGKTLGLVGLTGSGKTTLVRLLVRQYEAPSGTVFIGGRDVRQYSLARLRSLFSVVTQDTFLFSGTIKKNVAFGRDDAGDEEVLAALEGAGLLAEVEELPKGIETVIGERGVTLSGGQKQRVAIARALLLDRPIVILDDCLSAVDTETEEKILSKLKSVTAQRTAVIVSNRISSIKHADQIVVLADGGLIERGTHDELLASGGLYAELHERQQLEAWIESH